ncbi:hypothetical protein L1987_69580 [Smallanthus sonchifolius]|uniref:Uncharacterized protein n=1 Tax=Smallanthus sonchifolius TaxID=185202 RepID=A0ACB9B745_9ASTR|nr:hypothetical protein L1987_69580 [Smallanthus sonchifolius]
MGAKTLSYMKSSNKRTNRMTADIPLFGHVIRELEEFVPDVDPDLEVEEVEEEMDHGQGNEEEHEVEAEVEVEIPHSSGTLDAGIYGSDYYKSDSDERTECPASSSKRQADSGSDYKLEEPKAKNIKTGFEDLSSSLESLFNISENTSLIPTPVPTPQSTPPPSPQHVHIPTPPISPAHEPTPSVSRVKTLSLEVKKLQDHVQEKDNIIESLKTELSECKEEVKDLQLEVGGLHTQLDVQQTQLETQQKTISQQQQDFKALYEIFEQLKASLVKPQHQATTSTSQGETTSGGRSSSSGFVSNPEPAMTIFSGPAAKKKGNCGSQD